MNHKPIKLTAAQCIILTFPICHFAPLTSCKVKASLLIFNLDWVTKSHKIYRPYKRNLQQIKSIQILDRDLQSELERGVQVEHPREHQLQDGGGGGRVSHQVCHCHQEAEVKKQSWTRRQILVILRQGDRRRRQGDGSWPWRRPETVSQRRPCPQDSYWRQLNISRSRIYLSHCQLNHILHCSLC